MTVIVCCRLYETVHTLYPEVLDHISDTVEPFCITDKNSMTFSNPQFSHGPWKGYLVGVVGDVAAHEDDALWPNRVCYMLPSCHQHSFSAWHYTCLLCSSFHNHVTSF